MQDVSLDEASLAKLQAVKDRACVRDAHGRLIGYFWPAMQTGTKFRGVGLSEEEIKRRLSQGGGRSLAEIVADLEKRA